MVCQRDVEAGNTGIHQHRHKDAQLLLQHTGVAVVRVFLPDGKLVVNGQLRQAAADCLDCLHGKAGAVFGAAAVLVGALVEHGGAEAAAHTVAMHLHHIKPGLDRQHGSLAEAVGDFLNFLYRQFRNVGRDLTVQQRAQLLHRDFFGQHAGYIFQHGQHIGIRLVQLCADAAVVAVGNFGQLLVVGEALFVKQGLFKGTFAYRHITDDDHGAAAFGDAAHFFKIFLVRKPEGRRRKNDAVFQLQTAVINRTLNRFVHDAVPPVLLFAVMQAVVLFPLR